MKLYHIIQQSREGDSMSIRIKPEPQHPVYKGHFPGMPILPGALQVEIIKELSTEISGKELILKSAKSIKYMGFINPHENTRLQVELKIKETGEGRNVRAKIYWNDRIFTKFSGIFEEAGQ